VTTQEKRRPLARGAATTRIHRNQAADQGQVDCSASGLLRCSHSAAVDGTGDDNYYVSDYVLDREWADRVARDQAVEDERRDIVRRLFARATCATGVPMPFSPEWFAAPATVQITAVALLGQEYLPASPLKAASVAISTALSWRAEAQKPSFAELQRRRAQPGPLAAVEFDATATKRWVETGGDRCPPSP
jgi:hypothetical protein